MHNRIDYHERNTTKGFRGEKLDVGGGEAVQREEHVVEFRDQWIEEEDRGA